MQTAYVFEILRRLVFDFCAMSSLIWNLHAVDDLFRQHR